MEQISSGCMRDTAGIIEPIFGHIYLREQLLQKIDIDCVITLTARAKQIINYFQRLLKSSKLQNLQFKMQ